MAVSERADVRMFELQESTLARMSAALADDFAAIGIRQNQTLIGFVTVIKDGTSAVGYDLGLD